VNCKKVFITSTYFIIPSCLLQERNNVDKTCMTSVIGSSDSLFFCIDCQKSGCKFQIVIKYLPHIHKLYKMKYVWHFELLKGEWFLHETPKPIVPNYYVGVIIDPYASQWYYITGLLATHIEWPTMLRLWLSLATHTHSA